MYGIIYRSEATMADNPPPPLSDPPAWFAHADTSQSGELTADQILTALLADPDYSDLIHSSIDNVRELVYAVVPVFDRDGNGLIDKDEFCSAGGMAESLLLAMEQQQAAASHEPDDKQEGDGDAQESSTSRGVFVPTATAVPATNYGGGGGAYVPTATATAAVAPSAPPMPSAPPAAAAAAPSGLWECSSCSFVNRDCATCKACGAAGGGGGGAPPAPAPAPVPQPRPAPAPQPVPAASPARAPATTSTTSTQTLRVLIPPGTRPGQQMRVPTGGPNNESVLVAVPDQRRWQHNPSVSQQPYFDIKVQRSTAPAPVPSQTVASSAPPASHGGGSHGGGYGGAAGHHGGAHAGSMKPPTSIDGAAALASSILGGSMAAGGGGGGRIPGGFSQSMPPSYHNQSMGGVASGSHLAPISPGNVANHPTTLILKESAMSYTGDDSKIKDANGNTLFIIKAEMMTMSQRRYIYDSRGQRLGQLRRSRLLPSVHIGTLSNEKQCSVVMSGFMNPMNCNANIMLNERQKIGKISGNWRAKKFNRMIDGSVVAQVARKKTMQSMFMGADSYCIEVQPGVDLVFVSLLAVSLDELYHDKKGGMQSSMGGGSPYGRPHYGGGMNGMGGMGGMGGIFGPGF